MLTARVSPRGKLLPPPQPPPPWEGGTRKSKAVQALDLSAFLPSKTVLSQKGMVQLKGELNTVSGTFPGANGWGVPQDVDASIGVSEGKAKSRMTQRQNLGKVKRCYIHLISLVNACLTRGLGVFQGSVTPSTFRSNFRQTQADPTAWGWGVGSCVHRMTNKWLWGCKLGIRLKLNISYVI